ncbi:hypothetical protein C8R43DRAFT_1143265 [Mycena crocata]|nr:hypothetical protein C8R43DRAFT_1143265 [Mycena crocata]
MSSRGASSSKRSDGISIISNPYPSSVEGPGASIDDPMFVLSSPERGPSHVSGLIAGDIGPLTIPTRQRPLSSVTRPRRGVSVMLPASQNASSLYNRNIIRGPPSVILQSRSARASNSGGSAIADAVNNPNPLRRLSETYRAELREAELRLRESERRAAERRERLERESAARHAQALATAPPRIPLAPAPSATRPRRRRRNVGWRKDRLKPLTAENLYKTSVRPPVGTTDREHQRCAICLQIKSHPVSYACGHSHCYVCIRLWLEEQWSCPVCRDIMHRVPTKNIDYDKGLEYDFPLRKDQSVVLYSWKGLRFPKEEVQLLDADDELDDI